MKTVIPFVLSLLLVYCYMMVTMIFCTRHLQERVQLVETENADLRKMISDAIGSWTEDKQMTGKLQNVFFSITNTK